MIETIGAFIRLLSPRTLPRADDVLWSNPANRYYFTTALYYNPSTVEGAIRQYSLEGVRTLALPVLPDERGFLYEALRQDWAEFVNEPVLQTNLSCTYPNVVRAWHRHTRGQVDYFLVVRGTMQICAYDDETGNLSEIIASEANPTMVRIPGHYYHGTKTIGNETSLTVYFVTRLYDHRDPDEQRRPWNDPKVIPSEINGRKDDPRVGNPWDWFYPPHK